MQNNSTSSRTPPIDRAVRKAGQELAPDAGEAMAAYVTAQLQCSISRVASGARAAGLARESAVACFIHLCREVCEELCSGAAECADMN